jgi:hypothetical protein
MLVATETSSAEEAHALIEDGLVPDFILTDHVSDRDQHRSSLGAETAIEHEVGLAQLGLSG